MKRPHSPPVPDPPDDRFSAGIRAAARVLAAHGIDARPYLDRLDDATRAEIGGILVTRPYVEAPKRPRPPGLRTEWRCGCGAWNRAPCRVCGRGPDERYASGAELDALAGGPRRPRPPGGGRGKGTRRGRS